MVPDELVLDPQLKYWVLLPISVVMVVVGLLRSNVTLLLKSDPKLEEFKKNREKQFLKRATSFKNGSSVLTRDEFLVRQEYFITQLKSSEFFANKNVSSDAPANPLTDPGSADALMEMAKGNMMNYIPQTLIMAWVNYFFAGFVIMKLPFPITDSFKSMLQQGIVTPDLNVRYVSSISWYFVNLMGLKPVYSLIMNDSSAADELVNSQQQNQQLPNLGAPGAPKVDKIFEKEAADIQILSHESIYDGIIDRVLAADL
ncbi:hypothetical protein PSN45_001543 [Yamadazyma tenuis]|uniref:ER membrane protein complex subunit 3 n=1 Tax=Candida tenuis (strain ATCC 10573 / BCRC 21748 / CBS 615 / JCM 9827 / NBRC 10315 / NRRL Y-1498 / VKM Y-70) TaxID=590646 RepID=G3BFG2_CANTC|nr:uncharacterized protein CANTEDRAFT_116743 [Yamadazyma tenuis ATCC 10573]EGV60685.1 transmembrane protein [Yamadazyma tenuis ATCC 10573]WEJ94064.1 hypothetical protein PSN45_001543 [Yamadazyma tenuis]